MTSAKRKILIAGMGTSPGVLTNAVWALAHQAVPVIPDEVVVLMTKDGKESLRRALFEEGVWDEMFTDMRREKLDIDGKLVFGEASIHMIPDRKGNEIDDLRTGEDNLRAADFMLGELRKYTEDNGTELHVSIAGGRQSKTRSLSRNWTRAKFAASRNRRFGWKESREVWYNMPVVKSRNKKAVVKTDVAFYAQVRDMFVHSRPNCHTPCDELSLSHLHNKQIFAAKYKLHLPSEQELIAELRRERTAIESAQLVTKLDASEIRRITKSAFVTDSGV